MKTLLHPHVKNGSLNKLLLAALLFAAASSMITAQPKQDAKPSKDSVLSAAREIMAQQTYCALITIDSAGKANARTMNPFAPDSEMVVWIATNSRSQKIKDIRNNPNVCLYYANHANATGFVTINGKAELVDDMDMKLKLKRKYWEQSFPDFKYLLLIKVIPERIEVLNYKKGMNNAPVTWEAPSVEIQR